MAETPTITPQTDDSGPQQLNTPPYPGTTRIENGQAYDVAGKALGAVDDSGKAAAKASVDYEALAKQAGSVGSAPATIDYDALAKQAGSVGSSPVSSAPVRTVAQLHKGESIGAAPVSFWDRVKRMFTEGAPEGSLMASFGSRVHQPGDEKRDPQLISPEALMTPVEQEKHPILSEVGKFAGGLSTPQNVLMMSALAGARTAPVAARAVITGLTAAGFGLPILKQAFVELPEFRDAMLGTGSYADIPEEDRMREAEKLITHTVLGAAMLTEMGKEIYKAGEAVGGGGETNAGIAPEKSSTIDKAAGAVVDKTVEAAKKAPEVIRNAGIKAVDVIGSALGRTADFDTAIERSSKIPAKQAIAHAEKIANVREDLQAILNENKDKIEDPKSFGDAIDRHIQNNESRLQAEAGVTKGSDEPVVPNLSQRISDRLDKFFDDHKGLYGDETDVADAKKRVLEGILQSRNGQHLLEPNLFESENVRRRLNREGKPQFATNATPTTDAYKAGALEAADELRGAIDESYNAKGVTDVKEWREKEADLIDVRDKIYDAQKKADDMGEGTTFRSLMKKIGVPSTVIAIALGHPISGAAVGAAVLGDQIHQFRSNPNVNINRAIDLAARNTGAEATEPTFGKSPAPAAPESPVDHALHAELATHFNSVLDKTDLSELQDRFLTGLRDKVSKSLPFTPEEKDILGKINQSKAKARVASDVASKKTIESQQAEAEKVAAEAESARIKAAEKTKADVEKAKDAAEKEKEEKLKLGLPLNAHSPFEIADSELEVPENLSKLGYTPQRIRSHELGHVAMVHDADFIPQDVVSHLHKDAGDNLAEARWDDSEFRGEKGAPDIEKIKGKLPEILAMIHGGPVAEELIHGIPVRSNPGAEGDISLAKQLMDLVNIPLSERGAIMKAAELKARNVLTKPGLIDIIKKYAQGRKAGLSEDLHVDPETIGAMTQEIKNLGGSNGTDNNNPTAEKAGGVGKEGVAGGKGGIQGKTKEATRLAGETGESVGSKGRGKLPVGGIAEAEPELVYRARPVGEEGVPVKKRPVATSSLESAQTYAQNLEEMTGKPHEVVQIPLKDQEFTSQAGPNEGEKWYNFNKEIPETAVKKGPNQGLKMGIKAGVVERTTGSPEDDAAIKAGGGIPGGVLGHLNEDHVKMFHDPVTGTTLGFGAKEPVSAEGTKAKLEASRAQYAVAESKQSQPEGTKDAKEGLERIVKKYGTSSDASQVRDGASFITSEGRFAHLGVDDHPAVINNVARYTPSEYSADNRVPFINESGAVRSNFTTGRQGPTLSFSVPKDGVSLEQIDAMKAAVQKGLGRNGQLRIETANNPSNLKNSIKDFATANDVEPMLREIDAHPEQSNAANDAAQGANDYNKERGLPPVDATIKSHNPEFAKRVADAFDAMKHDPTNLKVQKAYGAMADEVKNQWDYATQKMGMKFEPWTKEGQPYANSKEMMKDVADNKHLYFFQGGDIKTESPMAEVNPQTGLTYNDMFRAVHDLFGHAATGFEFGPKGEENAYLAHRQMFPAEAIPALTSETRGQNSWVNFGKHLRNTEGDVSKKGETGYVPQTERPYAEQKVGLLPSEFQKVNTR